MEEFARTPVGDLRKGDRVRIDLDRNEFKALQEEEHARGWREYMVQYIGAIGKVKGILPNGCVQVKYYDPKMRLLINPKALTMKIFRVGDTVTISEDEVWVKEHQKGHGGWIQAMRQALGEIVTVTSVQPDGTKLCVKMEKFEFEINPWSCCLDEPVEEEEGVNDETEPEPEISHTVEEIEELLESGLLIADPMDTKGNNIFHIVAQRGDNVAALELLLDRGESDVINSLNYELNSVVHLAVNADCVKCVELLVRRGVNVNVQDLEGDTPLHCAVQKKPEHRKLPAIIDALTLTTNNFNYNIVNEQGLNVLHLAAIMGNVHATQLILERAPELVHVCTTTEFGKLSSGLYPLNFACVAGQTDVARVLITQGKADIELKGPGIECTPLIHAVGHKQAAVVELLVSQGADVSAGDKDGDTCVHLIIQYLAGEGDKDPLEQLKDTKEIKEIHDRIPSNTKDRCWIALMCYLIQHGADLNQKNQNGQSAMDIVHSSGNLHVLLAMLMNTMLQLESSASQLLKTITADQSSNGIRTNTLDHSRTTKESDQITPSKCGSKASNSLPPYTTMSTDEDTFDDCLICLRRKASVTFKPCGHKSVCLECSGNITKCFECRESIVDRVIDVSVLC